MQLFFAVFCLGIIGTSALGKCESTCEHKGKCFTEMAKKSLTCDSGKQQRPECDHHNPFGDKTPSDDELKKGCCEATCYSLLTAKKFTCPDGLESPTKKEFRKISADRKPEDLQKDCCKKPKVSCYTLFKANKFTCPATHFKPTATYLNDAIHEDMSTKTKTELQSKCCRKKSICYSKLTEKSLDCDGFGTMLGQDDSSRDSKLTAEADTKDSTLQKQCCRPNCVAVMKDKGVSCSSDTIARSDSHPPTGTSKEDLQKECCRQNCYTKMKKAGLTCSTGSALRDKTDFHDPGDKKGDDLKEQCCNKLACSNNYCFSAMIEKGIWGTCPEHSRSRGTCDGHYPFGHRHGESDEDRMKTIKAKSADEIKKGCCRMACYGMMKSKGLKCPSGYKGRPKWDSRNPFGDDDWTKKDNKAITDGCCQKVNVCYLKLRENNLGCSGYGTRVDEHDEWKADVDTSTLKTDEEIQTACCRKTCSIAMTKKSLECADGEKLRCSESHRPSRWKSFDQPDADLKWACCEPGPKRPKFSGCPALLKCSGDDCNSKCPRDERSRRSEHDDPFRGTRDFTKMKEADVQKYCCKPTCYDQVKNVHKATCELGTKLFDKSDEHNPFGGDTDMRTKSKKDILAKCCKPLNKCYTKLKQMGLSCDGVGKSPGETDDTKYDFDPLKLTKADDVKNKCCQPNCFYSIKKRGLKCKSGLPRSQHDGHNPFGTAGFATQSDDKILEQCCSENCYSYFTAKELTCGANRLRSKDDFHYVDFKGLKKPEDAKAECCRVRCGDVLKSRTLTCGEGYQIKDDEDKEEDWKKASDKDVKSRCCDELSEKCKKSVTKAKKAATWVDKRPKTPAALVTYLNDWGDRVLKTKTTHARYGVVGCKQNNKKFGTPEKCKAAEERCCFACDEMDCGGDTPQVSTCAGNEPSAFMKKFGIKECSTSSSVDFSTKTRCGTCPSVRNLFEQYDDGTLFSDSIGDTETASGLGATTSGFYGGVNLHNVRSEVRIDDKSCPKATAGLLISPRNSGGTFAVTGKAGTVFAIVGVVNEKSTDPTKGVQLGGAADYLVIGGSNEGDVDFTTSGKVSVVGMDNKGKVSAKGADNILVGNTVNSGKVILENGKTGAIINVANKDTAEVVVKGGTWKLHDVSNAKGGKVTIDGGVVDIGGPRTRNAGVVDIKSGKVTAKVRENTGTITIADGVTGTLLLCKNTGKVTNNGKLAVTSKPDDPFCKLAVPKPATKPSLAPKLLYYCRDSAKHLEKIFEAAAEREDKKDKKCSTVVKDVKAYWEAVKYETDAPMIKKFFSKCCGAKRIAPTGKKYILRNKTIKRKRVKAKTTVSIDFTDEKNNEKKKKFENAYIKRAKAKSSSTFEYKKKSRRDRRHLKAGTEVTATLEYDDDTAAEAGKTAVSAGTFSTELAKELKTEGVETSVTDTSASIETATETVVEEVLVDDVEDTKPVDGGSKPDDKKTTAKGEGATTSFYLSMAPSVLSTPIVTVAIILVTVCGLI